MRIFTIRNRRPTEGMTQPSTVDDAKIVNCLTCGTGRSWWYKADGGSFQCPECHGNPLKAGDGRPDHNLLARKRMVEQFGPRHEGDELLLDPHGYLRYIRWLMANPDKAPYPFKPLEEPPPSDSSMTLGERSDQG